MSNRERYPADLELESELERRMDLYFVRRNKPSAPGVKEELYDSKGRLEFDGDGLSISYEDQE